MAETNTIKIPCQCNVCNEVFSFNDAGQKTLQGLFKYSVKVCPHCGGNFTIIDKKTVERAEMKHHLDINNDPRYYK